MKNKLKYLLIITLAGNAIMLFCRIQYTHDYFYSFLLWNLFLAGIPLVISNLTMQLRIRSGIGLFCMLSGWFLFLPNAPYLITDLVHLVQRPPVPFWYDMVLVLSSALNGLLLGFISMFQVESILRKHFSFIRQGLFRIVTLLLMSYGVYIGRYLRFNSWDAIFNPFELSKGMLHSIDAGTIGFVLAFSFLIFVFYSCFRIILPYRSQELF